MLYVHFYEEENINKSYDYLLLLTITINKTKNIFF